MTFGTPRLEGGDNVRSPTPERSDAGFSRDIPSDVRDTVKTFIVSLHEWETAAWRDYDASRKQDPEGTWKRIDASRDALLQKWCCKDLRPQGAAFSSDPAHPPDRESLVSAACSAGECRVKTKMTDESGRVSNYEYHLRKDDGVWKIKQLYFDDGEELTPCQ